MHACTHTHSHTHLHVHMQMYTHTCKHAHTHACMHSGAHTHMRMHTHTHTHTHTHAHTSAYTHKHTHTHAHACLHTCTQTNTRTFSSISGCQPDAKHPKPTISRGKGDNFRLGHGTEDHVRHPRQLEALSGRRVVAAAVGAMHCLAITEDGEVLGWGKNEQGQLGEMPSTNVAEPSLLPAMEGKFIVGASCGPSQVQDPNA